MALHVEYGDPRQLHIVAGAPLGAKNFHENLLDMADVDHK